MCVELVQGTSCHDSWPLATLAILVSGAAAHQGAVRCHARRSDTICCVPKYFSSIEMADSSRAAELSHAGRFARATWLLPAAERS
jgi:hypothetical protein